MSRSPAANIVIAVAALAVSLGVFNLGRDFYAQAKTTQAWASTEGLILDGKVVTTERYRRSLFIRRSYSDRYRHSAQITYSYSIDGQEYISNQISTSKVWTDYFESRGRAGAAYEGTWLAMYPVGKKVIVYYDPLDPSNALLERDEYWMAYLTFGLAGLIGLVGLAFFNLARHQRQEGSWQNF